MNLKLGFIILLLASSLLGCSKNKNRILYTVLNGYTNKVSYKIGEEMQVFINAADNQTKGKIALYNISGTIVDEVKTTLFKQSIKNAMPWENGFGYKETFRYKVPNLPSGLYFWDNKVPFVVKGSGNESITIVYPSNTINAYNSEGGKSLYTDKAFGGPARKISFLRPMVFAESSFSQPFFKWIQANIGVPVNYIADCDLDDLNNFGATSILIIPGHNEYWTRTARLNFDAFVDGGKHALVLSGNTMWWQVRYENDQLICYKDIATDPEPNILLKTGLWEDPALNYPIVSSIGADFNNGGFGTEEDKGWDGYKIILENSPLLKGTGIVNGQILHLPTVEFDGAPLIIKEGQEPKLDLKAMNAYKGELIGYDYGYRYKETVGTFFVFQKTPSSGIIVNAGSTNWCSENGFSGKNAKEFRAITQNAINLLLNGETVFSE